MRQAATSCSSALRRRKQPHSSKPFSCSAYRHICLNPRNPRGSSQVGRFQTVFACRRFDGFEEPPARDTQCQPKNVRRCASRTLSVREGNLVRGVLDDLPKNFVVRPKTEPPTGESVEACS